MASFHQAFVFSHYKFVRIIQSNCMYWLHWKSEKNRTAKWARWAKILKIDHIDNQLCSLTCFPVFACSDMYQNIYLFIAFKIKKKTELNELNELEYSKTLSQMTSYAPSHAFLYLHAQTCMKTFMYLSHFKSVKNWAKWARILKNTITDEQLCT